MAGINYTMTENKANIHQLLNDNNKAQMNEIISNVEKVSTLTNDYLKEYESVGLTGKKKEDLENFKKRYKNIK